MNCNPDYQGKLIILSAPSGAGKTTIVKRLLERFPELEFSVSATSRAPRVGERDGVDYYFLSLGEFSRKAEQHLFVEWEEVYQGLCYGTLRSELERIWAAGHTVVFDVDVMGGISLKRIFGQHALSIFIMPPSVEELRRRLVFRATDAPETIDRRVAKAEQEIVRHVDFDRVIINDDLDTATEQVIGAIAGFMAGYRDGK